MEILSLASPVKGIAIEFLMNLGYSRKSAEELVFNHKDAIIPEVNKSVRYILQTIGTEWGRNCIGTNTWVDILLQKAVFKNKTVVDDVRFLNEAKAIKDAGGLMWKLVRPEVNLVTGHASEGSLDNYNGFDFIVINDESLDKLYRQIDGIVNYAW